MYCPKCFNHSLHFNTKGVIHVIANGMQMEAGRFLYHYREIDEVNFCHDLREKLEEFFEWYHNFQNQEVITNIDICTSDVVCDNKCLIPIDQRFSIVGVMISKKKRDEIVFELSDKYNVRIQLAK